MKLFVFFVLAAAAGLAAAGAVARQATPTTCSDSIPTFLDSSDPDLGCIAPGRISDIIFEFKNGMKPTDLAAHVDLWLNDFCTVGVCSDQTLEHIAGQTSASCETTFGNYTLPSPADFVTQFKKNYHAIRNAMCLEDASKGFQFCMAEMFAASNATLLKLTDPAQVISTLISSALNTNCNECTKAAFQLFNPVFPEANATKIITDTCGPAFAATLNTPAVDIHQEAVTKVFTANSAMARTYFNVVGLLLSVFAALALL